MSYSLGFDGGGTKTESVVLDAAGNLVGQAIGGPSNPLRVGFEAAFQSLCAAASQAMGQARLEAASIGAVCAGLAGAGRPHVASRVAPFLAEQFPQAFVHVTSDFEVALEAAAGSGPGVVLIAGTGSSAYGRNAAGETARAGGYGPWIGDEGSAFDIGRRAVAAVAQALDLMAPATLLSEKILAALACPSWDDLTERVAQGPDEVFPRLFPVVVEAADGEDSTAREILFTAALGLSRIALTVIGRLGLQSKEFILAKSGGVFGRSRLLDNMLDSVLASGARQVKIMPLEVSPAIGAARLAARLAASPSRTAAHGAKR